MLRPVRNPHPYRDPNNLPTLRRSVIAFVDILGFTSLIRESAATATEQNLLSDFHEAFVGCLEGIGVQTPETAFPPDPSLDVIRAIKMFSDNVVIGYPIPECDDGEFEFGQIFDDLSWFQTGMVRRGYFLRGAITVGNIYIDEFTAFGSGLIDAYEAERDNSLFPRIVITRSAENQIVRHTSAYFPQEDSPQNRTLLRDCDEFLFLNYLEGLRDAEEDVNILRLRLREHRDITIQRLLEHANNSAIFEKYAWTARYHNYFCSEYRNFGEEYLIPQTELDRPFSRLVQTEITTS